MLCYAFFCSNLSGTDSRVLFVDPARFRFTHQTSFVRRHAGVTRTPGLRWIVRCISSVYLCNQVVYFHEHAWDMWYVLGLGWSQSNAGNTIVVPRIQVWPDFSWWCILIIDNVHPTLCSPNTIHQYLHMISLSPDGPIDRQLFEWSWSLSCIHRYNPLGVTLFTSFLFSFLNLV